jgi:hypothetical protein
MCFASCVVSSLVVMVPPFLFFSFPFNFLPCREEAEAEQREWEGRVEILQGEVTLLKEERARIERSLREEVLPSFIQVT